MIRILFSLLLIGLSIGSFALEVTSYAKVSKNGQDEARDGPLSWITRALSRSNASESGENEGRSVKDIVITVSPVYVAPRTPRLQNGEAIDYPSTRRYSTLDHDMLAKLEAATIKKQIQKRYHPSASIIRNPGQSNGNKKENGAKPILGPIMPSNSDSFELSKPPFSAPLDYKPPDYLSDKPISKPITIDDYPGADMNDKPPDSYKPQPDTYFPGPDHDADFDDFPPSSSYGNDKPPKQADFSGHLEHPPYQDDHHGHGHEYHHELIYDHIPEYHDHHEQHMDNTEAPEMNDERVDKRPYSYYFIGKKLWYVPLYFSIYFIIYIAALVLKSIARHKISFPAHLAEVAGHARSDDFSWWDAAGRVLEGIDNFAQKFGADS